MTDKTYSRITHVIFVLNAIFLIWAILWKCGMPFIGDGSQRVIQLIPFRGNTAWEMQFNVLLFMPFGFLLAAVMKKSLPWQLLTVAVTSLLIEAAQYLLAVGRSDITDILLNTFGSLIGIGAYHLVARLFGKRLRMVIVVICLLIVALEIYMSVSFVLFGVVRLGFIMIRIQK